MATEVLPNENDEFVMSRTFASDVAASTRTPLLRVRATVAPGEEYKLLDQALPLARLDVTMRDEHGESALRYDRARHGVVDANRPTVYRLYPSAPGFLGAPVRFVRPASREPFPIVGTFDRLLSIELKELVFDSVEEVPGLIQQVRGQYHRVRVYEDRVEAAWVSMNAHVQAPEGLLLASQEPDGLAYVRCTALDGLSGVIWYVGVASQYNLIVTRESASGGAFTVYSNGRNNAYQLGADRDFSSSVLVESEALTSLVATKVAEGSDLTFVRALRQSVFLGFEDGSVWAVGTDRNFAVLGGGGATAEASAENIVRTAPFEVVGISALMRTEDGVVTHETVDLRSGGLAGDAICVVRRNVDTFEEDRWGMGVNTSDALATGDPEAVYTAFVERTVLEQRVASYGNPLRATSVEGMSPLVIERFERQLDVLVNGEWYAVDLKGSVDAPVRYVTQDEWDGKVLIGF